MYKLIPQNYELTLQFEKTLLVDTMVSCLPLPSTPLHEYALLCTLFQTPSSNVFWESATLRNSFDTILWHAISLPCAPSRLKTPYVCVALYPTIELWPPTFFAFDEHNPLHGLTNPSLLPHSFDVWFCTTRSTFLRNFAHSSIKT
jgi:hypothetical protein